MTTKDTIRLGWGWVILLCLLLACLFGLSNRARAAARDAANKQLDKMLHEAHEGRTEWAWEIK